MNILKKKNSINIVLIIFTIIFIFASSINMTFAMGGYETLNYDVDITVGKDNSFKYVENIRVDFPNQRHGIYRNIPLSKLYRIRDVDVVGDKFETSKEKNNLILKIGQENKLILGEKKYSIRYTLRGLKNKNPQNDYLYLDILPFSWESPLNNAKVRIKFPKDFPMDDIKTMTGKYGDKTDGNFGNFKISKEKHEIYFEAKDLPAGVGATIKQDLPEGYWKGAYAGKIYLEYLAVFALVLIFGITLLLRYKVGRNPSLVTPVSFYPPEGMNSLETGYFIDGYVDNSDVISLFFYLANKGFIDIIKNEDERYSIKLKELPEGEKDYINIFLMEIFNIGNIADCDISMIEPVYIDEMEGFTDIVAGIKEGVKNEFTGGKRIYTKKSKFADTISNILLFVGISLIPILAYFFDERESLVLLTVPGIAVVITYAAFITLSSSYYYRKSRRGSKTFLMFIISGITYLIGAGGLLWIIANRFYSPSLNGIYVVFVILMPFLIIGMRTRSKWSMDRLGEILGFKDFIKNAELDKLNKLIEENPNYFYEVLSYAYVFGLTKKWASHFENIDIQKPGWYHSEYDDNGLLFNMIMMDSMVRSFQTEVKGVMNVTPEVDGSSIVSGFSGGGFGGGGGGSW